MKLLRAWVLFSGLFCIKAMSFTEWKEKYGRDVQSSNESKAQEEFNKTVAAIRKHNSDPTNTYKQKVGAAAGMIKSEKDLRTGYIPAATNETNNKFPKFRVTSLNAPNSLNLTSKMSPVKKQGKCGSCWSMAATATMEYWNDKKVLSDQNIIDCNDKGSGCKGGSPQVAFMYARNSGLSDGLEYKYVSGQTGNKTYCRRFEFPAIYKMPKFCFILLNGNETMLRLIVAQFGPAVVSINSRDSGLDHYSSGVFTSKTCSSQLEDANHAVTVVGFGTDTKLGAYWIVRNSWGTDFGLNGYFQIKRGVNMCGIGNRAWGPC